MKTILIVEDEGAYRTILQHTLASLYNVLESVNGKAGLDMALVKHPDLILLDLKMPVMDGMTMLNQLRKDSWGKDAKVMLLTNLEPNDDLVSQVVQTQPTYYWIKSETKLHDLLVYIQSVLSH